ncbi:MAG: Hpt domain-containing protein [Vulcanimicrobiota bacterium]
MSEPIIDKNALREQFDGDPELLQEVKAILEEDCPKRMEEARLAIATSDPEGLARAAHSIKGAVSTLAAGPARKVASQLEMLGKGGMLELASSVIEELSVELDRLFAELANVKGFD